MGTPGEGDRARFFRYWDEWDEHNGAYKGIADAFAEFEVPSNHLEAALKKIQDEISANLRRTATPRITLPKEVAVGSGETYTTPWISIQKRTGYQRCNLGAACTRHNPKPKVDLSFMATEWDLLPDAK